MYDVIIIGAGPAGMTAGIYAARREMKALILAKEIGGQVIWASEIENYPGFKSISNIELIERMREQVAGFGVEIKTEEVKVLKKEENENFKIITDKGEYESKTVVLALGLAPRRLAISGEEKFTGKGVSYCANCDGPFYRNKTVAVVGGGNSAFDAAEILSKIAAKVYLIHRNDKFKAFDALVDEVKARENIELLVNSGIKEIAGKDKVEKIIVENAITGEKREIELNGVFIEIGRIAHTDLVADLVKRDERNQILVDEKCMTSLDGLFACGDVTQTPFKQITIAAGQATVAALAAYQYNQMKQGKDGGQTLDRSVKKK